ncbi:protein of unknown function [Kyrpidia spormannii]|uniref:Uncharacterized protein n=1 Tax=Kyrpidia spormannii TaxID=2055160 RepID=A0A6F9EG44_9BACL|nr:protein of unknown function [Kyrpidia spormannii]
MNLSVEVWCMVLELLFEVMCQMPAEVGCRLHADNDAIHVLGLRGLQDLVNESVGSLWVTQDLKRGQVLTGLIHKLNMVGLQAHVDPNMQFRQRIHLRSGKSQASPGPGCPWEPPTSASSSALIHPDVNCGPLHPIRHGGATSG